MFQDGVKHCDWPPQYGAASGYNTNEDINYAISWLYGQGNALMNIAPGSCYRAFCRRALIVDVCNSVGSNFFDFV
jgi:hypothetical protein